MRLRYWIRYALALWFFWGQVHLPMGFSRHTDKFRASQGILDLSVWNPVTDGSLQLDGEWEFYWDQLLLPKDFDEELPLPPRQFMDLPALWNQENSTKEALPPFGFATYRLMVIHPLGQRIPRLSMYLSNYLSSYELWVDGTLLAQNGKVGRNQEETIHQWLPKLITFDLIGDKTEIVLRVANFKHRKGGVSVNPLVGIPEQIEQERMTDIVVHAFVMGAYCLMGVFFIGVFLFWPEDRSVVYFIAFSLIFSFRYFLIGPRFDVFLFPNVFSFDLALRLEYLTVYIGVPLIVTFIGEMFPQLFSRIILRVFQVVSGLCALTVLLTPVWVFTELAVPFTLFIILMSLYGTGVMIQAARRKEQGSYMSLAGLGIGSALLFVAGGDYLGWFPGVRYTTEWAIFVFILSQALALARRLTDHMLREKKIKDETLEQKEEILYESQALEEANERMWVIKSGLEAQISNRSQKLRKAYDELAEVNKELDQFLYRYSHDLRSPITTLLGLNEVAETSITEKVAQKLFGHVKLTVVKMDILARKLMTLHDINTNQRDQPETFLVDVLIKEILAQYALAIDSHQITVTCRVENVPMISTHKRLIQIVLENVIENAIYYYDPAKENHALQIRAEVTGQELAIHVLDNGMGIADEVQPRMYDMFYRGTPRSPGSGLGLYLAQKSCEKLEGKIEVNSMESEYTEVSIRVPVQLA